MVREALMIREDPLSLDFRSGWHAVAGVGGASLLGVGGEVKSE